MTQMGRILFRKLCRNQQSKSTASHQINVHDGSLHYANPHVFLYSRKIPNSISLPHYKELDPECTFVCRRYLIDTAAFTRVYVVEEHTNLREELWIFNSKWATSDININNFLHQHSGQYEEVLLDWCMCAWVCGFAFVCVRCVSVNLPDLTEIVPSRGCSVSKKIAQNRG